MGTVGKIRGALRWVSLKTVAQLVECSTDAVRANVRRGHWLARRLGHGKRAHLRVALGADHWPVRGRARA